MDYHLRHHVRSKATVATELDASLCLGCEERSSENSCTNLSLGILGAFANKVAQVGIETADKSRGEDVPINECHELDEE